MGARDAARAIKSLRSALAMEISSDPLATMNALVAALALNATLMEPVIQKMLVDANAFARLSMATSQEQIAKRVSMGTTVRHAAKSAVLRAPQGKAEQRVAYAGLCTAPQTAAPGVRQPPAAPPPLSFSWRKLSHALATVSALMARVDQRPASATPIGTDRHVILSAPLRCVDWIEDW